MQKLIQIALRDIRLEFSSPMAWLTFLVLPIVFTLMFAGQFSNGDSDNGDGNIGLPLLVVDQDQSSLSTELMASLMEASGLNPELTTIDAADAAYLDGALAVLVIPTGFETTLLAGEPIRLDLRAQPGNTNSIIVSQTVGTVTERFAQPLSIAAQSTAHQLELGRFDSEEARLNWFFESRRRVEARLDSNRARISYTQPAAASAVGFDVQSQQALGQLITWVLIPLIGVSVLFVSERQYGTLRRLLTTPTGKATYIGGVILGQLGKGLVQMLILVLFGAFVVGIRYGRSPGGLALLLFAFGLAAVALGTMLGTFIKSDGQANGLSIMLGMVLALLGGCWFPLEFFPPAAQAVALFVPTRWALVGLTDLVVRGDSIAGILPEAGVLFLFAALFFTIGIWRFRYE